MFSVKIDVQPFLKSMRAARARFAILVIAAVRKATNLAADKARSTRKFQDQTGRLRRSIQATFPSSYEGKLDATARHAVWIERGNGPAGSYITPKHKPMLVFWIGGRKIVAHRVRTTKPRPFLTEAARSKHPLFESLCREAARNMFP